MKRALQYGALLVAILGGWWLLNNQYVVRDWFTLRSYDPPEYVVAYADDTAMSDYGRKLFYVSDPRLEEGEEFNESCPFPERSIILGCYTNNTIYLYKIDEEKLEGVEEVTAAHEMLHAGYARLSEREKRDVDALLDQQMEQISDTRIKELVEQYRNDDPASLHNEMHSIFGTEVGKLTPALEQHYAQYFEDRSQVVAISESYEQVFVDISSKIKNLENEIAVLKIQIEDKEVTIMTLRVEVDRESARLEALRASGDIPGYNSGIPAYNATVVSYNTGVDSYKALVVTHNDKVEKRNLLATTQNELVQSLDSKFEKISE